MVSYQDDIDQSIKVMKQGGIILYPTDTVWGLGCDASNNDAIEKIFKLKNRDEKKSMIILLKDSDDIQNYISKLPHNWAKTISAFTKPTTVIYDRGENVSDKLISTDGTIAIRITKDAFCKDLIKALGKPLVSTSANVSGEHTALQFDQISHKIKSEVDYVVQHRSGEILSAEPSSIIRIHLDGSMKTLR